MPILDFSRLVVIDYIKVWKKSPPPPECNFSNGFPLCCHISLYGSNHFRSPNHLVARNVTIENGSNILFTAGSEIELLPGFKVEAGANFEAKIAPCSIDEGKKETDDFGETTDTITTKRDTIKKESESVIKNSFEIFPNPFINNNQFVFSLKEKLAVTILIQNTLGQTISTPIKEQITEAGNHTLTFDASSLPPGIYFCTFSCMPAGREAKNEKGEVFSEVKKLVKIK